MSHYFPRLKGPRLYLSPVNPDDATIYAAWINDPAVTESLGNARAFSLAAEREMLERMAREGVNFAIVRAQDHTLMGNCSLFDLDHVHQVATCGLFIGDAENRGKGYGTEALKLLLAYGFDVLNLHNIMLKVFAFNQQGLRCYDKVGFKTIGVRRQAYFIRGQLWDEVFMDILPQELNRL